MRNRNRMYTGLDGLRYNSVEDLYEANRRWANENKNGPGIVFIGLDGVNHYSIEDVLEANKKIRENELEGKLNRR